MEENLENKEYTENLEKSEYKKISSWKNRVKWILIILWLTVLFLLLAGLTLQIFFKIKPSWWVDIKRLLPALILIPLYVEFLIIYFFNWHNSKRYLKDIVIISFFVIIVVRFFLTKAFMIRDYFEINCLWEKKIINDDCVDCKCAVKSSSVFSPNLDGTQDIDWKKCCKWTYTYNILHWAN